ncbi:hypothetical protein GN244_ATG00244 [Phytophthora infestans]|uniref:PH domain-containing protein n=1 Tax=Phytophthora infestans TaxID=4787 RepID=A0A833TUS8_PHYIN|nr:hypothetical protein GN244_ATG00244 [Phytophthora infestans]
MAFSGILKLKFGPFWFKTSILLVNLMPYGSRSASYILRVERQASSAAASSYQSFRIRYGAKGKKLRFLAPTAEVYAHWITVLREAFEGNVKVAKRARNQTVSDTNETSVGVSGCGDCTSTSSDVQKTFVNGNESLSGLRTSEHLDTSTSSSHSYYQHDNIVTGVYAGSNDNFEEGSAASAMIPIATSGGSASSVTNEVYDANSDDYDNDESSEELDSPLSGPTPTDEKVSAGQHNVFCMAVDHDGAATFSVYAPPQKARNGHPCRSERLFQLSFVQWAGWVALDLRDGQCLPEVFRLTSRTCKRLQLGEILDIVQPFFA